MIDNSKKILTGTLSFFVGLLAGKKAQTDKQVNPSVAKPKKRSGYFMELDESEDANLLTQPVAAVKQAVEKTKNATVEAAKQVAETVKTSEPVAAKQVETKTSKPVAAAKQVETKTSKPVAAAKQSVEKAKTSESGQKVAGNAEPVAAKKSKVELVQTAEGLKAEPAKPSPSIAASSNGQNKTETTFAPKYLNPANSSTSRRRPGANMTNFLDMANQVKKQTKD